MGMFDSVWTGESEIQFKSGKNLLITYNVGDDIPIPDGFHFTPDGAFAVFQGKVVAGFDVETPFLYNKWGAEMPYPEINP